MFYRLLCCSCAIIAFIYSTNLLAQNQNNPFSEQKGKRKAPTNSVNPEQVIDGRLSKNTIFNSSPLFSISDSRHKTIYAEGSSVPVWIESRSIEHTISIPANSREVYSRAIQYLTEISKLTKITEPEKELEIKSTTILKSGTHIKFQQKYLNIPIHGSELIVHLLANKKLVNGRHIPTPHLTTTVPQVAESSAISSAIADLKKDGVYRDLNSFEKKLLQYSGPVSRLIYYRPDLKETKIILSWEVEVRPNPLDHYKYIIDATTNQILHKQNHTCAANPAVSTATDLNGVSQSFGTYQDGSDFYMIDISKPMFSSGLSSMPNDPIGAIWTIDAHNTDLNNLTHITSLAVNSWDPKAVSAHSNADSCYTYFKNVHSRESLNDDNGTIISVINVTDNGQQMDNAYWNGMFMAYGNGDEIFKPLAGGLDVAAHEMTHGVIQNTANLNYQGQSGAINESFADIFGCMVDREDWQLGEDIMAATAAFYYPNGSLRDLSDPHNGGGSFGDPSWQPMHMNEYVSTSADNGGVHINSGIPNHAYYLFATAITKDIAEDVYYHALTNYLTASSQFIDLRLAVIQSASELFSSDPSIADAAETAFDQVGIVDGTGTTPTGDLPVNPGADYILALGTDQTANTLYNIDLNSSTVSGISNSLIDNKPSITDDGSFAYFVVASGDIIRKNLSTNSEIIFDNSANWDNVAVSRDGLLLAAVTDQIDSSIYVRRVSGGAWTKFKLYNPTYSGVSTSGPQYADALEWDYSGENLVYDCYNLTVNSNGHTIDYWSIGFINVWDKLNDTYASGSIKNLFDGLPSYLNMGNPTFAKNSSDIIAFDLIDLSDFKFYLLGTNIETGTSGYILDLDMGMLGFPTYSKLDDKIAFTAFNVDYDTTIFTIKLNSNKISYESLSSISGVAYLKVPVWYSTGVRVLGNQSTISPVDFKAYPNPFLDEVNLELNLKSNDFLNILLINSLGQTVKTLYAGNENAGEHSYSFSLNDTENGTYFIKVQTQRETGIVKLIKVK